ncbi:MAG TPA: Gfo/Idh/MocA family oxidoreductase [Anaerolineaceae bacterium]|nr:Gfo/Idh/MocA family oxidoreductase [Anaerolineaceae bacterium]
MTALPLVKSGILGFGFIGKTHAQAANSIPFCLLNPKLTVQTKALLRTHAEGDEALIRSMGNPSVFTNLSEFLAEDLDYVDICSPNDAHLPQALAAARAGKAIYCEKPMGMNLAEVRQMVQATTTAGVKTHSAFVLRYLPGIVQAKALLESGVIGKPLHYRAVMYHSSYLNKNRPTSWRLQKGRSGGGAWMDLGSHMVNLMQYLIGEPESVIAWQNTFIKQRPTAAGAAEKIGVDVDDWCLAVLRHPDEVTGTIEVSRVAAGTGEDTSFEIYCYGGALRFSESKSEGLQWFDNKTNTWSLSAPKLDARVNGHPISELWANPKYSQGTMINAHLASIYDFALCLQEGRESELNFSAALATQRILEAANLSSADSGREVWLAEL